MSEITSTNPSLAMKTTGSANTWAWGILTLLVSALFVMSGVMKIMQMPAVVQSFAQAGFPKGSALPIGMLEIGCVVLFLIPRTAVLGTFLLTGYLGGAIVSCLVSHATIALPAVTGLLVWIAAWLRVKELRSLLPLRRGTGG